MLNYILVVAGSAAGGSSPLRALNPAANRCGPAHSAVAAVCDHRSPCNGHIFLEASKSERHSQSAAAFSRSSPNFSTVVNSEI